MSDSTKITRAEIEALYAPFPAEAHTVREGMRNKAKTKIRWFTYLNRVAVQKRLEDVFPGEWEFTVDREYRTESYITFVVTMTIRGIKRTFNGGAALRYKDDEFDQDTEKGAMTEAFRRVAALWGVGAYLYDGPTIWTDSYEEADWDKQKALQSEATQKWQRWYNDQFNIKPATPQIVTTPTATGSKVELPNGANANGERRMATAKAYDSIKDWGKIMLAEAAHHGAIYENTFELSGALNIQVGKGVMVKKATYEEALAAAISYKVSPGEVKATG